MYLQTAQHGLTGVVPLGLVVRSTRRTYTLQVPFPLVQPLPLIINHHLNLVHVSTMFQQHGASSWPIPQVSTITTILCVLSIVIDKALQFLSVIAMEWFHGMYMCTHVFTSHSLCVLNQGFIQWGRWGEASPSKHPASPPKRKREREGEVHGGGRGACTFLRRIASDQYSLLLHDSII